MQKERIITIENLVFHYGSGENTETRTVYAVDGVNLDFEKGSFTAILGKNGSGKSTLA